MNKKAIAIMYDFDKTLCTKDMQEYTFIPNLGIDAATFWNEANAMKKDTKMDPVLIYMYLMFKKTMDNNNVLKREYLNSMGRDIELFKGVEDWFERINEYGNKLGVTVEHYIISSGLKEIIEGSVIGKYFKEIYASEFYYNNMGNAMWPLRTINYTNKTQFLIRINKGILDVRDDYNLNRKMLKSDRRIPYENMIYVGDGLTDVPCMTLAKENGGVSIAVYTDKSLEIAKELHDDNRINYMAYADYSENSEMEKIVKKEIERMATLEKEIHNTF